MDRRQFMVNLVVGGMTFGAAQKAFGQIEALALQISIGRNHGHILRIQFRDLKRGVDRRYNIKGTSSHVHAVTIRKTQFEQILNGQTIQVISSTDFGHSHTVRIKLAAE